MKIISKETYGVIGLTAGIIIGGLTGYTLGESFNRPEKVYTQNLNSDRIEDIVVKIRNSECIFLAQDDGTYKSLDEALKEQENSIRIKVSE